jgi:hypothetical protein
MKCYDYILQNHKPEQKVNKTIIRTGSPHGLEQVRHKKSRKFTVFKISLVLVMF